MNTDRDPIPSAWVWSHFKGSQDNYAEEVPLAWVWSQYAPVTPISGFPDVAQKRNRWDSKFLYAAAAAGILIAIVLFGGLFKTSSPHQMTNEELANNQISRALACLKEAYRITPRDETEKLIIRIEKILKN